MKKTKLIKNYVNLLSHILFSEEWKEKLIQEIEEALKSLTEREAKVLIIRFGLEDGNEHTLKEIGQQFKVTKGRIWQIEAKALRKLRHLSRSEKLKELILLDLYVLHKKLISWALYKLEDQIKKKRRELDGLEEEALKAEILESKGWQEKKEAVKKCRQEIREMREVITKINGKREAL